MAGALLAGAATKLRDQAGTLLRSPVTVLILLTVGVLAVLALKLTPANSTTPPIPRPTAITLPQVSATALTAASIPCPMWPADNIWNRRVDALPIQVSSDDYVKSLGAGDKLHAGFASGPYKGLSVGVFYNIVPTAQPLVSMHFLLYPAESDPGPYPYPRNAGIQGATTDVPVPTTGDRHVSVLREGDCTLFESWHSEPQADGGWNAANGAIFHLTSNALRPNGWTSGDAAGFAILPALVRYDEAANGQITHAVRFTGVMQTISKDWTWPARHSDGTCASAECPPMGTRFRLKAGVDTTGFSPQVRTILEGLKTYGMMLADSGDAWQIGGVVDARWNDQELRELMSIHGSDFEAVDVSGLIVDPNSGQSK